MYLRGLWARHPEYPTCRTTMRICATARNSDSGVRTRRQTANQRHPETSTTPICDKSKRAKLRCRTERRHHYACRSALAPHDALGDPAQGGGRARRSRRIAQPRRRLPALSIDCGGVLRVGEGHRAPRAARAAFDACQRLSARRVGRISWVFRRVRDWIARWFLVSPSTRGEDHDRRTHSTGALATSQASRRATSRAVRSPESPAGTSRASPASRSFSRMPSTCSTTPPARASSWTRRWSRPSSPPRPRTSSTTMRPSKRSRPSPPFRRRFNPSSRRPSGPARTSGQDGQDVPAHRDRAWALPAGVVDLLLRLEPALGAAEADITVANELAISLNALVVSAAASPKRGPPMNADTRNTTNLQQFLATIRDMHSVALRLNALVLAEGMTLGSLEVGFPVDIYEGSGRSCRCSRR